MLWGRQTLLDQLQHMLRAFLSGKGLGNHRHKLNLFRVFFVCFGHGDGSGRDSGKLDPGYSRKGWIQEFQRCDSISSCRFQKGYAIWATYLGPFMHGTMSQVGSCYGWHKETASNPISRFASPRRNIRYQCMQKANLLTQTLENWEVGSRHGEMFGEIGLRSWIFFICFPLTSLSLA